ncbi:MAG TPA: hypothetical protein VMM18_16880 [Gemmatimonadaceae bacterium]|nr:hypothetical protein [Gemmatimonadaceae bacterium]
MARSHPSLPRLAALGALGASAGLFLLFVVFVWWTSQNGGGMDTTTRWVTWISVGGVIVALIAVHLVFARMLMEQGTDRG